MRRIVLLFAVGLLFSIITTAQTRSISGKVTDKTGKPVELATIQVKGGIGVSADADGNFKISAKNGDILRISAVNFAPQEIKVEGQTTLSVVLELITGTLNEVIVTALGQTSNKRKVGYATSTFNNEAITRISPVGPLDGLQGKIAGANISTTGGPGSSTKVVLRGYGVIAGGNNQPLYVIDGVPLSDARLGSTADPTDPGQVDFGNSLNDINPNDIESITVLKGTAASSLYGSSAKNGAIMITTRRGKAGKLRIDYSGSANFSQVGKLPDFQKTFGQGWSGVFILSENGSWGPKTDGKDRLWGSVVDNSQLIKPFSFVEDNMRDFYNTGTEYNNTLALSGGTEALTFYFSYGNVSSDGVIPTNSDSYKRNTFALRTNSRFKNFTIGTSFNYVNRKQNSPFTGQGGSDGASIFESILQIPVDIPITDFRDYQNKFFNVDNYFTPFAENPYYPLYENGNTQNADRFFGNVDMSYKFTSSISAQFRLGGDFNNARTFGFKAVNAPAPGSWNDGANPEGARRAPDVGSVTETSDYFGVINGDFIVKYNKTFNNTISLDALVGGNYYQQDAKTVKAQITNLVIPGFYNLSNSSIPPTATDAKNRLRRMGAYAQATIGYKEQVFLTLNGRNDWSSTLPIDNNNFFYPGANLSWLASQTFDFSNSSISLLKLRASYGKTGNDAGAAYLVEPTLVIGDVALPFGVLSFPFNGVSAFRLSNRIGNANLEPVFTKEAEAGIEIRLFKNRIGLDAAVYDKKTDGQIFSVPITPSSGYTTLVRNLGLVSNKGVEIAFDVKPFENKNFTWLINYTFSKNWNKVENLTGGPDKVILNSAYDAELDAIPGKSVSGMYAPVPQYTSDGKIIVNPATGLPLPATEKGYYGDAAYDYMMGLVNTLTYKNFQLGFTLDYRSGGVMYSGTADLSLFVGNSYITTYNDRRPFIIPNSVVEIGTDADNKPIYGENTTPIDEGAYDTYWYPTTNLAGSYAYRIVDKSFLKLRDLTLSYRLPEKWASKVRANTFMITAYARNILLWTPESNIYLDPEASNQGNDIESEIGEFRTAPLSRLFGVSLKVSF